MSTCASSWVPSLILQRFSRDHTIWWQVLRFAICRELHSLENWFEMVILYQQVSCFTSSSTLPSLFCKLSMETLDFSSFAFLNISKALWINWSQSFLAFGGLEKWLNGSVEVGSSSVVAKISSSSSIKRCAGPICLRDDLSDNSRGEGSRPVHLFIYSVLPFCSKTRWICNVLVNSINQWDVDPILDACTALAWLDLVMLSKLNLNAEAYLYFTFSQTFKVSVRDFDIATFLLLD